MTSAIQIEKGQDIRSVVSGYGRQLLGFIKSRIPAETDAEDVLQEVWYQLSRQASLEDIEHLSGWLYRVTKNKIADLYRKKKTIALEQEWGEEESSGILPALLVEATHPEMREWQQLFREELMEALDEMPEEQSLVFVMNEIQEKTLREIANETGAPLGTITARKRYALQFLRKRLAPLYQTFLNQ
jgi:RNA polymerase sigma factor (sigma-70 family)